MRPKRPHLLPLPSSISLFTLFTLSPFPHFIYLSLSPLTHPLTHSPALTHYASPPPLLLILSQSVSSHSHGRSSLGIFDSLHLSHTLSRSNITCIANKRYLVHTISHPPSSRMQPRHSRFESGELRQWEGKAKGNDLKGRRERGRGME